MAGIFAGVLGPLAMLTMTASGLIHGRTSERIALSAWIALVVFAAIGYVLGWIANQTVEESVRNTIAADLENEPNRTNNG